MFRSVALVLSALHQALKACTLSFAIVLFTYPISAQEPNSPQALQAANELVRLLSGELVKQMTEQMLAALWPNLEQQLRPKTDAVTLNKIRAEVERITLKYVSASASQTPVIYARYFSAQELGELAAFYRSPTGAKSLALSPKIVADSLGNTAAQLPNMQKELAASIETLLKQRGEKK